MVQLSAADENRKSRGRKSDEFVRYPSLVLAVSFAVFLLKRDLFTDDKGVVLKFINVIRINICPKDDDKLYQSRGLDWIEAEEIQKNFKVFEV